MCVYGMARVCWDAFQDEETPIVAYSYQALRFTSDRQGSVRDAPLTPPTPVGLGTTSAVVEGLSMSVRRPAPAMLSLHEFDVYFCFI